MQILSSLPVAAHTTQAVRTVRGNYVLRPLHNPPEAQQTMFQ